MQRPVAIPGKRPNRTAQDPRLSGLRILRALGAEQQPLDLRPGVQHSPTLCRSEGASPRPAVCCLRQFGYEASPDKGYPEDVRRCLLQGGPAEAASARYQLGGVDETRPPFLPWLVRSKLSTCRSRRSRASRTRSHAKRSASQAQKAAAIHARSRSGGHRNSVWFSHHLLACQVDHRDHRRRAHRHYEEFHHNSSLL
jgi:hypothetical protein